MKSQGTIFLYVLITLSVLMTAIEVVLNLNNQVVSNSTQSLWGLVFVIISIMWAKNDAKIKEIHLPFDFGFLVYILWPLAFPYYLLRTRGSEGVIVYLGFISLWMSPWISGLIAYVYFT